MLKRTGALALALLALLCTALAEAPYCVTEGDLALLVDARGNMLLQEGSFEDGFPVIAGSLYAVGAPGDYALVDADGNGVSELRFGMIDAQGDSLVFRQGSRFGAMDRTGRILVDPVWTQLTSDGRGGWLALAGNAIDEIEDALYHIGPDGSGEETGVSVLGLLRGVCEDRMACCGADGLWGYVDGAGEMALEPSWTSAGDFLNGRAIVMDEYGCGVIDVRGNIVVDAVYRYIARCGEHFALLDEEGGLDLCDGLSGETIVHLGDGVTSLTMLGDAMAVFGAGETRLLDGDGRELCRLGAEAAFAAGVDGQYIAADGAWGEANQWIINPDGSPATGKYQRLLPLCRGRYAFMTMNGAEYYSEKLDATQKSWDYDSVRYGLMDGGGRELLPAEYRSIRALDDERLLLTTDEAVMLADRDGAVIRSWMRPASAGSSDETGE